MNKVYITRCNNTFIIILLLYILYYIILLLAHYIIIIIEEVKVPVVVHKTTHYNKYTTWHATPSERRHVCVCLYGYCSCKLIHIYTTYICYWYFFEQSVRIDFN